MSQRIAENESILNALRWRYATKRFDPNKKVSDADFDALLQATILAPSSFGLQPWKFIVAKSPSVRQQLFEHAWSQQQVIDASHFVVFAARREIDDAYLDSFLKSISETRKSPYEKTYPFRDMLVGFLNGIKGQHLPWTTRQTYIALAQMMTTAANMGIDTCPMEGISPPDFDRVLGLEHSPYTTVVACAVGHRHPGDKYSGYAKVRFGANELVHVI